MNALDRQAGGPDDNAAQAGHLVPALMFGNSRGGPNSLWPGFTGDGHLAPKDDGVRRLTPVECERLMSWPDNWTAVDGPKTPDSRRYAACGDGVVSNVAEWIGRRIVKVASDEGER